MWCVPFRLVIDRFGRQAWACCCLVLQVSAWKGRHGGARKFQVSRGTKRSVPVRQARLVVLRMVAVRMGLSHL